MKELKELEHKLEKGTLTKKEVDRFIKELKTKARRGHR